MLLAIVDNQTARTKAALAGLREETFRTRPAGAARSISEIGRHMLSLRRMQVKVLAPALATQVPDPGSFTSIAELRRCLDAAAKLVKLAVLECGTNRWSDTQKAQGSGQRSKRPTIARFVQPMNDFTSHIGDVRTLRAILGNPVGR
jgi:hypothetical protein